LARKVILGFPIFVDELAFVTIEVAADRGTNETNLALGLEAVPKKNGPFNFQSVGAEGLSFLVDEFSVLTIEVAADRSAKQTNLALGLEAVTKKDVSFYLQSIDGERAGMRALHFQCGYLRTPEVDTCRKFA